MMKIATNEIHLWLCFHNEINDARLLAGYREILAGSEREQERRFYFAKDAHRYLVTRALVRTVLSRYSRLQPQDWLFTNNKYGRPDIANRDATGLPLSFNISHTDGLIALAVSSNRAIGVDVENTLTRSVSIDIADRYFAEPEVTHLLATSPSAQQNLFFEYWTFKEAYIKARGMGLAIPLDKFSFRYPSTSTVQLTVHPELADDAARWQLWQMRPSTEHLLALCAERVTEAMNVIVTRKIIPTRDEALLEVATTKISS